MDDYGPGDEHAANPNELPSFSPDAVLPQFVRIDSDVGLDSTLFQTTADVEVVCPRCGKRTAKGPPRCPYCSARLTISEAAAAQLALIRGSHAQAELTSDVPDPTSLIIRLLVFYVLLLCTNLLGHWIASAMGSDRMSDQSLVKLEIVLTAMLEGLDTLIVVVALCVIPVRPLAGPQGTTRQIGWIFGPMILGIALGLNLGYHALLQNYVQFPNWTRRDLHMPVEWSIILVCVQPGIVEELFFRYLALGTLTRVMGVTSAILVASVMFGMAHSAVLLSIPILTVVGVALGIVRVWSGSIILPMLLHALHNAVVIYFETTR